MRSGLSYRIVGGVRFYERKEIKDSLAYLKLLINPHDDVSLRRVINVPARGIGKGVMDAIERVSAEEAPPLLLASGIAVPAPNSLWTKADARRRRAACGAARARVAQDVPRSHRQPAQRLRAKSRCRSRSARCSIRPVIFRICGTTGARTRRAGSRTSWSSFRRRANTKDASPEASLGGFTDQLSLLSEADEGQGSLEARIWLMTLHAAKGLEFPTVIMAGLEEGVFPHSRAFDEEDEMAEERRLCYVGMTRARAQLVLTGAARRRVFGEYQSMEPSRFMDEVPPQLVERIEPAYPTSSYQSSFGGFGAACEFVRCFGQAWRFTYRPARRVRARNVRIPTKTKISHGSPACAWARKFVIRNSASGRSSAWKSSPTM